MHFPWMAAVLSGAGLAAITSVHCLAMCSPLAAASRASVGQGASARYLFGRGVAYSVLGLLAGSAGAGLAASPWTRWAEAVLAWVVAALLVYSALPLLGLKQRPTVLRIGKGPRRSFVGFMLARTAHDPWLLGAATALLPCAPLYTAIAGAAALHDAGLGALMMASFALVTSPALLGGAQIARLAQLGGVGQRAFGVILVLGALMTALRPISSLRADAAPACPLHSGGASHHGAP